MASEVTKFSQAPAGGSWPRAGVFDCDGLLINTAECWRGAFTRVLRERRGELRDETLMRLNGASVRRAAEILGVRESRLHTELRAAFERANLSPLPGAAVLIDRLRARMPLAVATNGPADLVGQALERVNLRSAFHAVISAETEARDKPAPDVYLAACARLVVDPSDAIAFEDSAVGVEAARRAGLTVVLVPSNPHDRTEADLCVPRLDDHRLAGLLRLDDALAGRRQARGRRPENSTTMDLAGNRSVSRVRHP